MARYIVFGKAGTPAAQVRAVRALVEAAGGFVRQTGIGGLLVELPPRAVQRVTDSLPQGWKITAEQWYRRSDAKGPGATGSGVGR